MRQTKRPVKTGQKEGLTRRSILLAGASLLTFTALSTRLAYLQIFRGSQYRSMAKENSLKLVLIPPSRGRLLDRNREILAGRKPNQRLLFEARAESNIDPKEVMERLEKLVPLSTRYLQEAKRQIRKSRGTPVLLKEHLNWEELSKVEFHTPDLPGVTIDVGEMRDYPLGEMTAHSIGYVYTVAPEDNPNSPLLKMPGFKIGKSGIEKALEETLQGQAGVRSVEVNVHGMHISEVSRKESVAGKDVMLTMDARLQKFVAERLGEESGSVVVMDVKTGDVLAFVSNPAFDPNRFSEGIRTDYWNQLRENPRTPLLNKASAGMYPPGSTFKMMTGLAGLEAGVITPKTRFYCPGHFYLGSHRFNCWKEEGHGSVNLKQAIERSCDTFFYNVGQRLKIEQLAETSRKFGLGSPTGILIPGEKGGLIPDEAWKKRVHKQAWQGGDTVNAAIGQGYVLTTPLQLAVMCARLVNGGYAVTPQMLLNNAEDALHTNHFDPVQVSQEHLAPILEGMQAVVNSPNGTAYGKRILEVGKEMGGKTGTAQVRRIIQRGMNQNQLPWEMRHHALFVGYAPVDKPRFCVSVVIEHGGGGSSAAAPVAKDILEKVQSLYPPVAGAVVGV